MTLSFSNISKLLTLFFILFSLDIYACEAYKKSKSDKGVVTFIYDIHCKLIFKQSAEVEPVLTVDGSYVKYFISLGTYVSYTTFVDRKEGRVSPPFYSIFSYNFQNEKVLYNLDNKLIFSSMFGGFKVEIKRDFSDSATISSIILDSRIGDEYVNLNYLRGDYEEFQERIEIESIINK